jgi:hypothetical protein
VGGVESTTTVVAAWAVQPVEFVTVTVYVPAFEALADETVGFCAELVNPLGPLQVYDVPPFAKREIVLPGQYGPPFDAEAVGSADTVTVCEWLSVEPVRSRTVSVTV